jgi:hypothetical protein
MSLSSGTIQQPTRLSQSSLWEIQEQCFINKGLSAWDNEVPFYISNNAFIGHHYADLICKYLLDYKSINNSFPTSITILEVGGGPGKFAFHFLKKFKKLLKEYKIDQNFVYVFSDIVDKNLENISNQSIFEEYISNDELDYGNFNLRTDTDFKLQRSNKLFSELVDGPCIVIANYAFDCLPHDGFVTEDGKLGQMELQLKSRFKNFDVEKIKYINDVNLAFTTEIVDSNDYYQDPRLQNTLQEYIAKFKGGIGNFLFPTGACDFTDKLKKITNNNYLLLVGDKGFSEESRITSWNSRYRCTYDGCYSFAVNFDVLGKYIKANGGDSLLSSNENVFKVNVFLSNGCLNDFTLLQQYYKNYIDVIGPCDMCEFYEEFHVHSSRFTLTMLLSYLKLSYWDPQAYSSIHSRLLELLPDCDDLILEEILMHVNKVKENLYPIKLECDVYILLSEFYTQFPIKKQENIDLALSMAQLSAKIFNQPFAYCLQGALYEDKSNTALAIDCYRKGLSLNKKDILAKQRLRTLTGKPYLNAILPVTRGLLVISLIGVVLYWLSM